MVKLFYAPAALVLLSGCGPQPTSVDDLHSTAVTFPNGKTILAETMRRDIDQMRGMMYRDAMRKDHGMLFLHAEEGNYPYWMYHVRIPLDIIWLDRDRRIVEISANTPPCPSQSARECPNYGGHEKARYVLELEGGGAAANGLRLGDTLSF